MSRKTMLAGALLAMLALPGHAAERLVVVTPDIAEIVVALGAAGDVVGRDRSSKEPQLAHAQVVGFSRALNAETIAGLKPTLVLGSAAAQPPTLWPQLKQLKLRAEEVSAREDGRDFADAIRQGGPNCSAAPTPPPGWRPTGSSGCSRGRRAPSVTWSATTAAWWPARTPRRIP